MPWCEPLSFFGRRRAKTVNGVETRFLSAGDEEIAEYTSAGVLLRRYIPGPGTDMPVAMVTPQSGGAQEVKYIHADRQGSVLALSSAAGALVEGPYTYDPYGVSANASVGFPFRYTARRLDPETGLYYYRARYYSAALGRFLQTDPIGYQDQMNLYGYVGNDPLNANDPSGEETYSYYTEGNKYKVEVTLDIGQQQALFQRRKHRVAAEFDPEFFRLQGRIIGGGAVLGATPLAAEWLAYKLISSTIVSELKRGATLVLYRGVVKLRENEVALRVWRIFYSPKKILKFSMMQ